MPANERNPQPTAPAAAGGHARPRVFRTAVPASPAHNVVKTAAQVVVVWGLGLFVVPWAIAAAEARLGLPGFDFPGQRPVAVALFVLASVFNLATAWAMARHGLGTPLPLDCARRLVVRGPYRWLRNPMAVAGLAQGVAVAIWLGSPPVLAYVAAGGLAWQYLARPLEEADLSARFGAAYEHYRRRVPCWRPRLAPYRPDDK